MSDVIANRAAPCFQLGYRKSLDGARGICIILVLLTHGQIGYEGFGFIGVNTFFVLSGFLITSLLIAEYDNKRHISLIHFYFRRVLRLFPALAAMLLLFIVVAFLTDPRGRAIREVNESLFTLFYFSNWAQIYHLGRHVSLVHTWSLAVEEQFYIVWPWLLLFLLDRSSRSSLLCWIILGVFLSVLARVAVFMLDTTNLSGNILSVDPHRLQYGTDTRADSLLLGCFAGALVSSNLMPRQAWFSRGLAMAALVSGPILLGLGTRPVDSPMMMCAGWLLISLLGTILILHLATASATPLRWFFENSALVFVGQISYGLYVWHFPILEYMAQHNLPWQHMGYALVAVPVAVLSFYLIEKPCLKWKQKFSELRD